MSGRDTSLRAVARAGQAKQGLVHSHLLAAEDEALLLGRDALLLLDTVLDPAHTVIWLDVDLNLRAGASEI